MAFYVLYVWCLGIMSFRTRKSAVASKQMSHKYFVAMSGDVPERVAIVGRHYDNQFQLPLYYLVGCCAHLVLGQVNAFTLVVAWGFVASRILHTFIHLGSNHVMNRAMAYIAGWIFNLLLWGQLVLFALSSTVAVAEEVKKEAKDNPASWSVCERDSECTFVEGACEQPVPINKKHKHKMKKSESEMNILLYCARFMPPSPRDKDPLVKCIKKECTLVDTPK